MPAFISQNCWVVPSIEQAVAKWLPLGVGPFLLFDVDLPDAIYRGTRVPLSFSVALAQAGPLQIELIQQHSDGPSAYRDTVPLGATGFHHVFKIVEDYAAETAALKARGIVLATEAVFGSPFCYADTRAEIGAMVEIAPDGPVLRKLNQAVADAAQGWDGADPIRRFTLL